MSTPTQVPKARALYSGDINKAVIAVQLKTGIHINDAWWNANVGNHGSSEQILDRFDAAYEKFVREHEAKNMPKAA